jgi:serine protease Do
LREDDVIVGVGNRQVGNLNDFKTAVAGLPKDRPVSMLIRRGDWAQYALVRPEVR